jgi:SOS response regulatory protein OraA/RecX
MSQALRKLTANIKRANTLVIFINQIRMKIGVMFGNPETTTGGNALKFYASVRLDIRRIGAIKRGDEVVGNETRVKVVKNKIAPPFREALFDILYGEGISRHGEIIELGVTHDIIEKSGAWYAYNGEKIGQGKDNTREFLREHAEMSDEIEAKIRAAVGVPVPGALARGASRRRIGGSAVSAASRCRSAGFEADGTRARCAVTVRAEASVPRNRSPRRRSRCLRDENIRVPKSVESSSPAPTSRMPPRSTACLDELVALGYLSDARFAHAVVAQKSGSHSKRAIGAALKAHGVDNEAAVAALEASEVDDHDAMVALWRRKFRRHPQTSARKPVKSAFCKAADSRSPPSCGSARSAGGDR